MGRFRVMCEKGDGEISDPLVISCDCDPPLKTSWVHLNTQSTKNNVESRLEDLYQDHVIAMTSPDARTIDVSDVDADTLPAFLMCQHLHKLPNMARFTEEIQGDPAVAAFFAHLLVASIPSTIMNNRDIETMSILCKNADIWENATVTLDTLSNLETPDSSIADIATIHKERRAANRDIEVSSGIANAAAVKLKSEFDEADYFQRVDKWLEDAIEFMHDMKGAGFGSPNGWDLSMASKTTMSMPNKIDKLMSNKKLRQILERMGRMAFLAQKVHTERSKHGVDEIVDVVKGDNIPRFLPSSLLPAMSHSTKPEFIGRLADKGCLQYDMQDFKPKARGPIIVAIDESGSMRHNGKDVWAKGILGGAIKIAQKTKRAVKVIRFSDTATTITFPAGQTIPLDVIEQVLCEFLGGGTSYENMVSAVIAGLGQKEFDKSDVLIISDGLAVVSTSTRERYKEACKVTSASTQFVFIIDGDRQSTDPPAVIKALADTVYVVNSTTCLDTAVEESIFQEMYL